MVPKKSLLAQMEEAPGQGWRIKDIATLCNQVGLTLKPPSSGSHYKVISDALHGALTVPYRRPIKPFYIKELVKLAHAHVAARDARKKEG